MSREYPARPIVGIGAAVLREGAVLLVRRGRAPALGAWSLPGGAQKLGETAEAAARRELLEETALCVGPLILAAHVDSIHHDAQGQVQYHYTILDFAARWSGGTPQAGGDATEIAWGAFDALERHALSDEMCRVIGIARRLLAL